MSYPFPYPGPIAPETNPKIMPQWYEPSRFVIEDISTSTDAEVTTSEPNNYVVGQQVRFSVPPAWGMSEIDGLSAFVTEIVTSSIFVTDLNTTFFTPFNPSPAHPSRTVPQITAIGDINSGPINKGRSGNGTFISGSFINISPALVGSG